MFLPSSSHNSFRAQPDECQVLSRDVVAKSSGKVITWLIVSDSLFLSLYACRAQFSPGLPLRGTLQFAGTTGFLQVSAGVLAPVLLVYKMSQSFGQARVI